MQSNPNEESEKIALDVTLEFIHSNEWEDPDGFGLAVARTYSLLRRQSQIVDDTTLNKKVKKATGFFRFNHVTRSVFFARLCKRLNKHPHIIIPAIYRDEILNKFENDLRVFVESKLRDTYDLGWKRRIPETILKNMTSIKQKQIKAGEKPSRLLDYATYGELYTIIQANWQVFEPYFLDGQWLQTKLIKEYGKLVRNPNAHFRRLSRDYEKRRDTVIGEIRMRMR